MRSRTRFNMWMLLPILTAASSGYCVECSPSPAEVLAQEFSFVASSVQGRVGDIVAVDVGLQISQTHEDALEIAMMMCFDPDDLEFVDVLTTPFFDSLAGFPLHRHVGVPGTPRSEHGLHGLFVTTVLNQSVFYSLADTRRTIPLLTVYFRIVGEAVGESEVTFCDDEFTDFAGNCVRNWITYLPSQDEPLSVRSTRHVPGVVRILEGEPTHPDLPDLPPRAKVYPDAPDPEDARVRYELVGGVVQPGAEIGLDLEITSAYEFSGFTAELAYSPSQLELIAVEELIRPGSVEVSETMGLVGVALGSTGRRIGRENEPVRVATFHFQVASDLGEAETIEIEYSPGHLGFDNFVLIEHEGGAQGVLLPDVASVGPLELRPGLLKVQRAPARMGDVNFDRRVDVSDAVAMLEGLFGGRATIECRGAEDFNRDHQFDLSDPVALLNHLFAGGPGAGAAGVLCR